MNEFTCGKCKQVFTDAPECDCGLCDKCHRQEEETLAKIAVITATLQNATIGDFVTNTIEMYHHAVRVYDGDNMEEAIQDAVDTADLLFGALYKLFWSYLNSYCETNNLAKPKEMDHDADKLWEKARNAPLDTID